MVRGPALSVLTAGLCALATAAWGQSAPTLVGAAGETVVVEASEGQPLLLHFWATWCPSCTEDLASLETAAAACPSPGPRVYAVNVGETQSEVDAFVSKHGIRLPMLRDPKGKTWRALDGRGLPMNFYWRWPDERTTDVGPKDSTGWQSQLAALGCHANGRAAPEPGS